MTTATIWMGGLTPEMDAAFVTSAFANMGYTALSVKVIVNKAGQRANYCFVDFGDVNIAREVVIKVNNQPIPGTSNRKFKLNRSEYGRSSGGAQEYSLFVGDLDPGISDDMLLDFFRVKYPSVRAAKVCFDERGYPKGYGFVRFYNETEINQAVTEMQGARGLGERPIKVNRALKNKGASESSSSSSIPGPPKQPDFMDPQMIPGFMHMQMQYIQQMQTYMEQCHQYAQQAAVAAGWAPNHNGVVQPSSSAAAASTSNSGSVLNYVEQQHEQLVSETAAQPEDDELVDPNPPVDIAALNQKIIDLDDKLFYELELSRWCPELAVFGLKEQRPQKIRKENPVVIEIE